MGIASECKPDGTVFYTMNAGQIGRMKKRFDRTEFSSTTRQLESGKANKIKVKYDPTSLEFRDAKKGEGKTYHDTFRGSRVAPSRSSSGSPKSSRSTTPEVRRPLLKAE